MHCVLRANIIVRCGVCRGAGVTGWLAVVSLVVGSGAAGVTYTDGHGRSPVTECTPVARRVAERAAPEIPIPSVW